MSDENWKNNQLQYPRLIAEMEAAGVFDREMLSTLTEEMDLTSDEVMDLVGRAQKDWDRTKQGIVGAPTPTAEDPPPYSAEEVRRKIYTHMRVICQHWACAEGKTEVERMEALCFSLLNIFDGTTMALPAMDIRLAPHPTDKQFHIDRGERWYEPEMLVNDCFMHEEWYQ